MSLALYPEILRAAFVYFAQFPLHANVLNLFTVGGSNFASYEALKTEIEELTPNSLIDNLDGYVFGANEDAIKKQIEDMGERMFLFLDYGNISNTQDNLTRKNGSFQLGVTVARCVKPNTINVPENVLLGDETLNALRGIRTKMIDNSICSPFSKKITFPHEVMPFFSREWSNATGWSMMFDYTAIDFL